MEREELRKILEECETGIEVHEDEFCILTKFVRINKVVTLRDISNIKIIYGERAVVWFNCSTTIDLEDLEELKIFEIKSYL